ncbi:MAG: dihydrofolate reductase family protein [Anaerolineae bacterium]|nr:dihydrofolate reductase family protein [Anaerolineae bacterium]
MFENSISLDGFVAGPNDNSENGLGDGGEALFKWYSLGDVAFPLPGTDMVFRISRASADFLRDEWGNLGAMVAGRRMFDIANAWGGYPPGGGPCFIVTHHPPGEWIYEGSPFTFVTDGVESAVAQAQKAAGDKAVSISSASIAQQCIKADLLDELLLNLAPVLLGGGVRLFDHLGITLVDLEPLAVVQGLGVTHLKYRIVK